MEILAETMVGIKGILLLNCIWSFIRNIVNKKIKRLQLRDRFGNTAENKILII